MGNIEVFGVIGLTCLVLAIVLKQRREMLVLKNQYRLFSLRDKLRMYVIEGKISKNSWAFDYLDSSISKIIKDLDSLSLGKVIALGIINRKNEQIANFHVHFMQEVKKNKEVGEIYAELGVIMAGFLVTKNIVSVAFAGGTILSIIGSVRELTRAKAWLKKITMQTREYPQTSTSYLFCNI